jgi:G3E family GTPase
VLVNELGKIDIDSGLLDNRKSNAGLGICTDELTNGCICCSVKDDLQKAVMHVLERSDTVDYLVRPLPVALPVIAVPSSLSS